MPLLHATLLILATLLSTATTPFSSSTSCRHILMAAASVGVAAAVVAPPPPRIPSSFSNRNTPLTAFHATIPPPVDFAALGQMALLGEFDAMTPIITHGQQNTFEGNTFSILELAPVAEPSGVVDNGTAGTKTINNNMETNCHRSSNTILSVPILLASFEILSSSSLPNATSSSPYGITSTCVLSQAPHQVYIGGYFTQVPLSSSSFSSTSSPSAAAAQFNTGINYVGVYDSKLKRFLNMDQGLDGPVHDLFCDSSSNQVYVVGQFRAPEVIIGKTDDISKEESAMKREYQALGAFGGGVAIWRPNHIVAPSDCGKESPGDHCRPVKAQGAWEALPFKGVNGVVHSVAKTQDGTFFFGGQFDTTTDGEEFSAPNTQPVDMSSVKVSTGNGVNSDQDRSILCQTDATTTASTTMAEGSSNWIMRDNIPGYWRAQFPLLITPTLFRLWNVNTTGPGAMNRGTKTFSIMAQPSNHHLNLSYVDRATNSLQYCTVCTLLPRVVTAGSGGAGWRDGFQDFRVVEPTLLQAAQVDVKSWYGLGGGLGGIQVFQSEIFARAVNDLNSGPCSQGGEHVLPAKVNQGTDKGGMTAHSSSMGADWKTTKIPDGWQTVLATSLSSKDEGVRKQAFVDLVPYLQESGMYDVYLYTPGCGGSVNTPSPASPSPSNACANRGSVDVNMYFGSPENVVSMTISQVNSQDKWDKIYSGMIIHSTGEFRPHVVVGPSISKTGTSGGGSTPQTVIVDSIQFVKQATLNNTNSLIFYKPGGASSGQGSSVPTQNGRAQGLDGSIWGNLPTQLPSGAVVNSMAPLLAGSSSMLFIAGEFQDAGYSHIVAWDGNKFVHLGSGDGGDEGSSNSGVDGAVRSITLEEQSKTLYIVGAFNQAYSGDTNGVPVQISGGFASYSIQSRTWTSLGNVSQTFQAGAQFQSVELMTGPSGEPQLLVSGKFSWSSPNSTVETAPSALGTMMAMAIWDIRSGTWIQESESGLPTGQGQQFEFGFVYGQISYLNRILGSVSGGSGSESGSESTDSQKPVVLIAGMIDSLDTYRVTHPENMAWLNEAGQLQPANLIPSIPVPPAAFPPSASSEDVPTMMMVPPVTNSPTLPTTNTGLLYYNRTSESWVTIVGGAKADGSIGAGYFYSTPVPTSSVPIEGDSSTTTDSTLSFKSLNLATSGANAVGTAAIGEIFALGLSKSEVDGFSSKDSGRDLLLIGGQFKSGTTTTLTSGLAVYDLIQEQVVTGFTGLRGLSSLGHSSAEGGEQTKEPTVNVIKNRPGHRVLVVGGDFAGVGKDTICEGVCLWDPAAAQKLMDKTKPLEGSFKSLYGDNGAKKNLGVLKGIVNDIAFEDDKSMYVAGDLEVNGVACGVASFNFEHLKWTTFGSMLTPAQLAGTSGAANGRPLTLEFMPQSDIYRLEILPATKNAPIRNTSGSAASPALDVKANDGGTTDSNESSSSNTASPPSSVSVDPNDTTHILEQGFILLVSGRIVLGTPLSLSSSPLSFTNDRQESSLAFFDGQSWFPYLQSSRNSSRPENAPIFGPTVPTQPVTTVLPNNLNSFGGLSKRLLDPSSSVTNPTAASAAVFTAAGPITLANVRIRDQGVFRGLAIAHLPRIIARNYLAVPYVILISIAISLGLIILIVLLGFLYVWLRRRFFATESLVPRPKLGSSFMEEDLSYGHDDHHRLFAGSSSGVDLAGTSALAAAAAATAATGAGSVKKRNKKGLSSPMEYNNSGMIGSLGVASALEGSRPFRNATSSSSFGAGLTRAGSSRSGLLHRGNGASGTQLSRLQLQQQQQQQEDIVYSPNSTIAEATGALVTEFVKNHEQQRESMVSTIGESTSAGGGNSSAGVSSTALVNVTQDREMGAVDRKEEGGGSTPVPPSPDRASKQPRFSGQSILNEQGRVSTSSDLTNSTIQGRFSTFLAGGGASRHGPHHSKQLSIPTSNVPSSPVTAMTTPEGNLYASSTATAPNGSGDSRSPSSDGIRNTNSTASTGVQQQQSTNVNPNAIAHGGVIYYAKYPFRAREIGELGFKTGDRILVVDQSDDIWWMGVIQDATGQQMHGVFPSNYVGPTP
ncbi:hypothetical protein BG004_006155 [Podila humilis]|nr:hypothetical protein BG004_006155 [Podila humilis]